MNCFLEWLKASEPIALWVEGIALVGIFIYDRIDSKHERQEAHADRVAGIYETMRRFLYSVIDGIRNDDFGPNRRFDSVSAPSFSLEPYAVEQYSEIWEASYRAILVNEKFAAYVKERVDEAAALQDVNDHEEFNKKLDIFYKNWNGDVMAKRMKELS